MDVAVIGASGACGRQLVMQLLERQIIPDYSRLQLVGRRGGSSEHTLWGLKADVEDAFADWSPAIEIVVDAEAIDADIVVMLAGATVSTEPGAAISRAELAKTNAGVFEHYARAIAQRPEPPIVVVQSNPVELGVSVFSEHVPKNRVLGAGGWSDSLRLRQEFAQHLGLPRRSVGVFVLGEHGENLVPIWSLATARGVSPERLESAVLEVRGGRTLLELPSRIADARAEMLAYVRDGRIGEAYDVVQALPADVRIGVKPFFTTFTSQRTTEAVTARSAADVVEAFIEGERMVLPAQVMPSDEWADLAAPVGLPVVLGPHGWNSIHVPLADDELEALSAAADKVAGVIAHATDS